MEYVANYWVILLVAFILVMLIILSYLIDKEIRKAKNDDKIDEDLKNYYENEETNEPEPVEMINNNDNHNEEIEPIEEIEEDDDDVLDYDELDVEDIDDDFNKVISKKKVISSSLKESVEAIEVTDVDIEEEKEEEEIELPEIRIKKEKNEEVW